MTQHSSESFSAIPIPEMDSNHSNPSSIALHPEINLMADAKLVADTVVQPIKSAPEPTPQQYSFSFTGTGSEYFKIWIVNLLLTIITFGIYYPWAKVRKLKYIHRNTILDNTPFDYLGNGQNLLKGMIISIVLSFAFNLIIKLNNMVAFGLFSVVIGGIVPWLLWKSLRFKLSVTSYKSLPFSFKADLKESYITFIPMVVLNIILLSLVIYNIQSIDQDHTSNHAESIDFLTGVVKNMGVLFFGAILLQPAIYFYTKKYQHNHYEWAGLRTSFHASLGSFYKAFGVALLPLIGYIIILVLLGFFISIFILSAELKFPSSMFLIASSLILFYGSYFVVIALTQALFTSRFQNLIWNYTQTHGIRFYSTLRAKSLAWLYIKNAFFMIITLGFYWPFALINITKMKISSMTLITTAPLMYLAAENAQTIPERNAVGDAVGSFFDMDISL